MKMFRRNFELVQEEIAAHSDERREGVTVGVSVGVALLDLPRFKRSPVNSSAHFEKRKLGRIVSKLSIVDKLEILEELDDDDDEDVADNMKTNMWSSLVRKDSGLSSVSTVSEADSSDQLDTRVNKVGYNSLYIH